MAPRSRFGVPFFLSYLRVLHLLALALVPMLRAELKLPAIISDHMLLQQKQSNPIWGWDTSRHERHRTFAGQTYSAVADGAGKWTVKLRAATASATPQTLTIAGTSRRDVHDVLVGEVGMCSGQSNMGWTLGQTYPRRSRSPLMARTVKREAQLQSEKGRAAQHSAP